MTYAIQPTSWGPTLDKWGCEYSADFAYIKRLAPTYSESVTIWAVPMRGDAYPLQAIASCPTVH